MTSEVVSATRRTNQLLPFAGGFVIDFLVVSALIRLESSSVVFVERFTKATANGKKPMCIIMIEPLRLKADWRIT